MITSDALRGLIDHLESRVARADDGSIHFRIPSRDEMLAAGLEPEAVDGLLAAPWLDQMTADVVETPDYCDRDADPAQVERYARDVVGEYIRKRFQR